MALWVVSSFCLYWTVAYSFVMHRTYWDMFLLFLVFRTLFIKFHLVEVPFSINWRWLCCFYPKCIRVWKNAYWFADFELTLHPWNEAHLAMVCHLLDVFLSLTCRNFTEKFVFAFTEETGLQCFFPLCLYSFWMGQCWPQRKISTLQPPFYLRSSLRVAWAHI